MRFLESWGNFELTWVKMLFGNCFLTCEKISPKKSVFQFWWSLLFPLGFRRVSIVTVTMQTLQNPRGDSDHQTGTHIFPRRFFRPQEKTFSNTFSPMSTRNFTRIPKIPLIKSSGSPKHAKTSTLCFHNYFYSDLAGRMR